MAEKDLVTNVLKKVTESVDEQIEQLDNMKLDDFETLRQKRMKAMKDKMEREDDYIKKGHGKFEELKNDGEFFDTHKKSNKCIFLLSNDENYELTKILEHHLKMLAIRWFDCKFAKLTLKNCPFLFGRIQSSSYPTLLIIENSEIKTKIVKFTNVNDISDSSYKALRNLIHSTGIIGEESTTPSTAALLKLRVPQKKTIQQGQQYDNDDSDLGDDLS